MKNKPNETRELLVNARYWMGELHGWYWSRPESARNSPKMKELIRDIQRLDRFIKEWK